MSEAKYSTLYKTLKGDIESVKYASGERLPSENALTRRYNVSRSTVQQAFRELEKIGLISRCRGRGTFVTQHRFVRKIGFIIPGVSGWELFPPILTSLVRLARQNDCSITFSDIYSTDFRHRRDEAKRLALDMVQCRVSGVIFQPLEYSPDSGAANREIVDILTAAGIPVVLIDSDIVPFPARGEYDLVSIDNEQMGELIATHLLDAGAHDICYCSRPDWWPNALNRMRGVILAMTMRGHKWEEKNFVLARPDSVADWRRVFRGKTSPDAVICEDDAYAATLIRTLGKIGLQVPEDVLLAGFDDISVARQMVPPLTTVRQPYEQIAALAFRRLLERIAQPMLPPVVQFPNAELVVRDSSVRKHSGKTAKRKTTRRETGR